jgi:hypothetical protein
VSAEKFVPQVGDEVDVVLRGKVRTNNPGGYGPWILVPRGEDRPGGRIYHFHKDDLTSVTKVTPPLPTTPGSVVRSRSPYSDADAPERFIVLQDNGYWYPGHWRPDHIKTFDVIFDAGKAL